MREDFTFPSADGRTQIHAVRYVPEAGTETAAGGSAAAGKAKESDTGPKAVLQLVHGMVEYIDRYDGFAAFMAANGFVVVGHDHLGHGQSVVSEEDLGYFAKAEHPSDVVIEDMQTLRRLTQERYPGLPYCILGHSMGSYLLRKYLTRYGEGLAAAIVMGTGDVDPGTAKAGLFVIRLLKVLRGERFRSTFVQNMTYSKPYQKFDLTGAVPENSWLTKDTEIVKRYYADPLCTFVFTLNAYQGLIEATLYDTDPANIAKIPADLPILLASGADDPVGDCSEGVNRVYQKFAKAGLNVQLHLYENDRHEILNETDRGLVWHDMLTFLESSTGGKNVYI